MLDKEEDDPAGTRPGAPRGVDGWTVAGEGWVAGGLGLMMVHGWRVVEDGWVEHGWGGWVECGWK